MLTSLYIKLFIFFSPNVGTDAEDYMVIKSPVRRVRGNKQTKKTALFSFTQEFFPSLFLPLMWWRDSEGKESYGGKNEKIADECLLDMTKVINFSRHNAYILLLNILYCRNSELFCHSQTHHKICTYLYILYFYRNTSPSNHFYGSLLLYSWQLVLAVPKGHQKWE